MKNSLLALVILLLQNSVFFSQEIINGDFDQGPQTGWTQWSKGGYGLIGTEQFFSSTEISPTVTPRSGQYMARLGGFGYEENFIVQNVTLPNTSKVYLKLYYQDRAFTGAECSGLGVGAQVRVYVAGQVLLDQRLCYYNTVNNWTFVYFDLSAAAGQTIEIGFRADAANSIWSYIYLDDVSISSSLTDVGQECVPLDFILEQNYPNPFNPETEIKFCVPEWSEVQLTVNDVLGKHVSEITSGEFSAGTYSFRWNGSSFSSGIYFLTMNAQSIDSEKNYKAVKKMILMK
jgi:hypothetical protein